MDYQTNIYEYISTCPQDTVSLGEKIAGRLEKGSVVALCGGIGSGKTCLAAGIARGLGIEETITSPTYTIISEYPGKVTLYHIDAYRLNGDEDFEHTGALELLGAGGITVVEWSDRIPNSLPSDTISINIEITGENRRVFRIKGVETLYEQ